MNNKMFLARSADKEVYEKAEYGGAVTSLLIYALETGLVDAVVGVEARKGNRYEGIPVLLSDKEAVKKISGSLHCGTPNIARFIKEYLGGASRQKLAVTCKPCDARGIIEIVKREKINLDKVILVGLNCTGTISPITAQEMYDKEFKVDPEDVTRENIDDGELTITLKDGTEKTKELAELEKKGYGRRENCRRCEINIPRMADLACGKWGGEGKKMTFIEVCSDRGAKLMKGAREKGYIHTEIPKESVIRIREEKSKKALEISQQYRKRDFESIKNLKEGERLNYWMEEFNNCIKCYGCRDACPICYCQVCILEANRDFIERGKVPPGTMFPLTRLAHVADSCVNCGQCQDACPMELPLSILYSLLNNALSSIFDYIPGMDPLEELTLTNVTEKELQIENTFLDIPSLIKKR